MKNEALDARVTAAFVYSLETLVELLEARHGPAQEFKSVKKAIMIGDNGTHRWVDPPEKVEYIKHLKATLAEFMREDFLPAADDLFDPIIVAYYTASRAKNPVKGKVKEPFQPE